MNSFQRVIKYCAIAFAIVLAVGIISAIANAIFAVATAVTGAGFSINKDEKLVDYEKDFTGVTSLDINHYTGELKIKTGDTFRVEASNVPEDFTARVSGDGTLNLYESRNRFHFLWFNFSHNSWNSKITVYLPENFIAESAKIDSGAGKVDISALHAEKLKISGGAGNITAENLTADDEINIDGGVGNIDLTNVNFKDADFDCGVGELNVSGAIDGDCKIDSGVGNIDMDLQGNADQYNFNVDTGLGAVRVNGEKLGDDYRSHNNADYSFRIDGGVGNINIDFTEKGNGF